MKSQNSTQNSKWRIMSNVSVLVVNSDTDYSIRCADEENCWNFLSFRYLLDVDILWKVKEIKLGNWKKRKYM